MYSSAVIVRIGSATCFFGEVTNVKIWVKIKFKWATPMYGIGVCTVIEPSAVPWIWEVLHTALKTLWSA